MKMNSFFLFPNSQKVFFPFSTHTENQRKTLTKQNMSIKNPKLFGKWSFDGVKVDDASLTDHIAIHPVFVPHSSGRFQKKRFRKVKCPIVERLVNGLMFKMRSNGKKLLAVRIVRHALEIAHLTAENSPNPIQIVVDAVSKGGPREDSTRVGAGGVVSRQAVDGSPLRRVAEAISLMCMGARE